MRIMCNFFFLLHHAGRHLDTGTVSSVFVDAFFGFDDVSRLTDRRLKFNNVGFEFSICHHRTAFADISVVYY